MLMMIIAMHAHTRIHTRIHNTQYENRQESLRERIRSAAERRALDAARCRTATQQVNFGDGDGMGRVCLWEEGGFGKQWGGGDKGGCVCVCMLLLPFPSIHAPLPPGFSHTHTPKTSNHPT